ncbi:helix-turn-helix domain-containing protein [Maribacter sp.]|uniref:helix-turn-helix domain-containing protein n=1 Tax=Maribacter sp. TaxID=1897614 RepID=UPI003C710587
MARTLLLFGVHNHLWDGSLIKSYNLLEDAIALSYSLFLFVKSIRLLYAYQQLYPDVLKYDNLKWIKRFLQLGGIVFIFWIIAVLFNTFSSTFNPPYTYYPLRLSSSILIYWVGYQAFFHYVVLKDRIQLRGVIRKSLSEPIQESRTDIRALPKSEKEEELFKKINTHIVVHQRYLDPVLSLDKVSEELGIGISNLSKLINQYSNRNFSDYINHLRVEESKELLGNANFKSYTIVSIGLECGFNSKSTFYTAFKKFTGLTPTQYRKKNSQKS